VSIQDLHKPWKSSTIEQDWDQYVQLLREKWFEVPTGKRTKSTKELLELNESELMEVWSETRRKEDFSSREWYRLLYSPIFKGKKIIDVGCGFGFDTITFAQAGAQVTCVDILESNILTVRSIANIKGIRDINFLYVDKLEAMAALPPDYDFIWCAGSFHNAPFGVMHQEAQALLKHLKMGGRWIQLAYPRSRWLREGSLPFDRWGEKTDSGAPWMEWYDLDKLLLLLKPASFRVVMYFEYHNNDFNWFDLLRER
jgi:2-polyprenyl-3-methyl-5-hydroxy-6-metoxy-1,4-benzoquinol methylase